MHQTRGCGAHRVFWLERIERVWPDLLESACFGLLLEHGMRCCKCTRNAIYIGVCGVLIDTRWHTCTVLWLSRPHPAAHEFPVSWPQEFLGFVPSSVTRQNWLNHRQTKLVQAKALAVQRETFGKRVRGVRGDKGLQTKFVTACLMWNSGNKS